PMAPTQARPALLGDEAEGSAVDSILASPGRADELGNPGGSDRGHSTARNGPDKWAGGRATTSGTGSWCWSGRGGRRPDSTRASPAPAAGCRAGPPRRRPGTLAQKRVVVIAHRPRGSGPRSPDPAAPARADLIRRDFTVNAAAVNTRWCGDITYLPTWEGWL